MERKYLLCSELEEGFCGERIAYLIRVNRKIDRNGSPFLTFYFKSKDKVVLIGRKFRIEDYGDLGTAMLAYNRTVVRIHFVVQIYCGSYYLLVDRISLEKDEDGSVFFDEFDRAGEVFEKLSKESERLGTVSLHLGLKTARLFQLKHGLSGAYLEMLDVVYQILQTMPVEFREDLLRCFLSVINPYFRYLTLFEKLDFVPKSELIELASSVDVGGDSRLTSISADILITLMDLGKPEHLYAYLIGGAFQFAKKQMNLVEMVKSSPKNLRISTSDGDLIFY